MNPQEQKIQELENRIRALENPQFLPQRWIELMIANGFFNASTIISLTEDNGLTLQENEYLIGRVFNSEKTIFLRNKFSPFYVKAGQDDIYSVNTYTKADGSLAKLEPGDIIVLSSTGTPPDPIIGGTLYAVLTSTTDSFTVDDGLGSPITFTDTGIGTHYWYKA